MKFTVQKSAVIDVLSRVQGLTGRKSNLAITSNVLMTASGAGLTIAATDLETGFEGTYPAKVESDGSMAISSRKFFEIIRDFPPEDIHIFEIENRWIQIGNQNIEYHIVGMNPDDFPTIPQLEGVKFQSMESEALKKMIERTSHIGASDDKRAHIVGVFFEKIDTEDEKGIRMVSTDGSRLSKVDYPLDAQPGIDIDTGIIIPKKGLIEVAKFLPSEGTVEVGHKDNHFIIKRGTETIIIRLLEGEFPEYQDIIQRGDTHAMTVNRQTFLMMLKRMSILSSESYKGAIFQFSEGKLAVSSTNPDIGESKEDMAIEFSGDPIAVAFNPRFFIESLSVLDDEKAVVHMINEESPCFIEGSDDKNYLSIIMPMRI